MVRPRCPWRMQAIYGDQPPPTYSLTLRFSLKLTAPDVAADRPRAHADRSRDHHRRHPSRIRGRVRDPCPRTPAWCTLLHGRQRSTGPRVFAAGATGGGAAQGPPPYADLDRRFIVAFWGPRVAPWPGAAPWGAYCRPWTSRSWTSNCPKARGRSSSQSCGGQPFGQGIDTDGEHRARAARADGRDRGGRGAQQDGGADGDNLRGGAPGGGTASPVTGRPGKLPHLAHLEDARVPSGP